MMVVKTIEKVMNFLKTTGLGYCETHGSAQAGTEPPDKAEEGIRLVGFNVGTFE
jgi:hypothetical protein